MALYRPFRITYLALACQDAENRQKPFIPNQPNRYNASMLDELEKTIQTLASSRSGWVSRRDAAENLGKAATLAYRMLAQYADEPDVDVQRAVYKALEDIRLAVRDNTVTEVPARSITLADLVNALDKPGKRTVQTHDSGYRITIALPDSREQTVYVSSFKDQEGVEHVRLVSPCSSVTPDVVAKALRANFNMTCGALAITDLDGEPRLALVRLLPCAEATPREFKSIVKQIGFYADWLEKRLTHGSDVF